jgi:hypothetical protein
VPTNQWLIFGYRAHNPNVTYGRTATLADPQFDENGLAPIAYAGQDNGADYSGAAYMNVFDPDYDVTDQNMMKIGNSPMLVVAQNRERYRHQQLQIVLT